MDSIIAAHRAAPGLDPQSLYGASSAAQGDPGQAATNSQAIAGLGSATKTANTLRMLDAASQRTMWNNISSDERDMLRSAGYGGPPKDTGGGGIMGFIHHVASDIGGVVGEVPHALGTGFHDVANAAGAPLRFVQRAIRTGIYAAEDSTSNPAGSALAPSGSADWGKFFSPHEWATAWRATQNGESTFNPGVMRQLSRQYDPATLDLAKRIATITPENFGHNAPDPAALAQITKGMDPATAQNTINQVRNDPHFKDLVSTLVASKLNFGNFVLGERFMHDHGELAKTLSGGINATIDWFGDPVVIGAKVSKAANVGRYIASTPEDVARLYETRPAVQKAFGFISDHLASGNVDGLVRAMPKLAPVAEQMSQARLHTADEVANWFAGEVGFRSLLSGRAGGMVADATHTVPTLTRAQAVGIAAKGGLRNVINWAAESPAEIADKTGVELTAPVSPLRRAVAGPARLAQSMSRLVPEGHTFDPQSPAALTTVQRLADIFLPSSASSKLVNTWAAAGSDLGLKRNVFKGLLGDIFNAAHLDADPTTAAWRDRFLTQLDDNMAQEVYSTVEDNGARVDQILNNGVPNSAGILENHLTRQWSFPSFNQLLAHSTAATWTRRLLSGANAPIINSFMNSAWKPLLLLRLGFPIRAGGEELFGAMLRHNPLALAKARMAMSFVGSQAKAYAGPDGAMVDKILPWHPLRHWTQGWKDSALKTAVQSPADLIANVAGNRARQAFRNVEGRLAGTKYVAAARRAYEGGYLENAYAEEVSAVHNNGLGFLESPQTTIRFARDGSSAQRMQFAPTGKFKGYAPTEELFKQVYKKALDEVAGSPWARTALEHLDAPEEQQIAAIADHLERTPAHAIKSPRWSQDRAGNIVGQDITHRQALEDWADVINKHVKGLIHDPTGAEIPDLRSYMLTNHEAPPVGAFDAMDPAQFPLSVKGPEVAPVPLSRWNAVMDRGFDGIVGRPMNWMVRQPLWLHNFATEYDSAARGLRVALGDSPHVDQIIADTAAEAATRKTIPYIHNPRLRSQFSVATQNLMPFWFAQEQFYKRWVNNFRYAPEAFRRAQLMMMGLRHTGVLHTDDTGNDTFMYPAIGQAVQDAITKGFSAVTGHNITLPIPVGFSGDVKFISPGLERLGVPSFGPLASIPMKLITARFPELQPAEQGLLGRGAQTSVWEQLVPTTIARLLDASFAKPETSSQYASAMMQAIQYLDANGMGLPPNATSAVKQTYIDRVKNWTRALFFTRTLLGFAAPASPTINLDPQHLSQDLRNMMTQMPANEAFNQFMLQHPNGAAYTVFQSDVPGKAQLQSTQAALDFMDSNREFLSSYPLAGAWFIPQTAGQFNQAAYNEQLALGLRERRTPEQFIDQIRYAAASPDYFDTEKAYQQAYAGAKGNSSLRASLTAQWDQWKAGYLASNPIFSDMLQAGTARLDRQQTLAELSQAIHDPRAPQSPQTTHTQDLIDTYNAYLRFDSEMAGRRDSAATTARKGAKQQMIDFATQYIADHPDVAPVYQRLIAPDLGASANG